MAPLGHELVERGLVLGEAQPIKEVAEFALLLFEPPQRFGAVLVKSVIAARAGTTPAAELLAHARQLVFHAVHLAVPALAALTSRRLAPEDEPEDGEPDRPPED